jgi:hypothetical protein
VEEVDWGIVVVVGVDGGGDGQSPSVVSVLEFQAMQMSGSRKLNKKFGVKKFAFYPEGRYAEYGGEQAF